MGEGRGEGERASKSEFVFARVLSTPFHKYDHVCCADFRFWRGATREHPPKWGCDRGATRPEPKSDATLRAAVLFGPDVVARSLQTPEGYARRSRLVWAENPSPQTWLYLWNGVLSIVCWFSTVSHRQFDFEPSHLSAARPELIRFLPVRPKARCQVK